MTPSWPTCSVATCQRSSKSLTPIVIPLAVPPLPELDGQGYTLEVEAYFCALHEGHAEIALGYDELTHAIARRARAEGMAAPLLEASR